MNTIRHLKKTIIGVVLAAFLASTIFVVPTFAAGGAYVSDTYVEVAEGSTAYISVGVENAAGSYSVSADGCVSANGGGWLDNETATIGIFGSSPGSGTVTIYFDTLATYDEEAKDGTTLTVSVNVYTPEDGYTPDKGEDGAEEEKEEETTKAEDADKLKVTIDGAEYTVVKDLSGFELPKGFTETDGSYNGEKIKVLSFGNELTLYVLKKNDDGSIVFKVYDEKSKKFEDPKSIAQNKVQYFLLDIPADVAAPEGYTAKDVQVADYTVKGFVADDKTYEDFYYVRALADGTAGYYSFDIKQGSIQRCMSLEGALNSNEMVKAMQEEAQQAAAKAARQAKLMKILLLAAAVIIVGLLVAVIILAVKNKKKRGGGNGPFGSSPDDYDGPQGYGGADDFGGGGADMDPIMPDEDMPAGVHDFDAYDFEIEDLIAENKPDPWKALGMKDHGDL